MSILWIGLIGDDSDPSGRRLNQQFARGPVAYLDAYRPAIEAGFDKIILQCPFGQPPGEYSVATMTPDAPMTVLQAMFGGAVRKWAVAVGATVIPYLGSWELRNCDSYIVNAWLTHHVLPLIKAGFRSVAFDAIDATSPLAAFVAFWMSRNGGNQPWFEPAQLNYEGGTPTSIKPAQCRTITSLSNVRRYMAGMTAPPDSYCNMAIDGPIGSEPGPTIAEAAQLRALGWRIGCSGWIASTWPADAVRELAGVNA